MKGKRVAFVVGPTGSGAWAEYAVADASAVIPLRKDVRDEDGAALIVNPLTAAAMVEMVPAGGAFVASGAASQLGKLMAGYAKDSGKQMIGLTRRDAPMEVLKTLGAKAVLNETSENFAADLKAVLKAAYTNAGKKTPKGAWKINHLSELPELIEKINADTSH